MTKGQTCQIDVWQRSRRTSDKGDPYWLHVYIEDGTSADRNLLSHTLNPVPDSNTLKIPTGMAEKDLSGRIGQYAAELSISTPALDDQRFKTEAKRDAAPLSFQVNQDKWTSDDGQRCSPSSEYVPEPNDEGHSHNGFKPGDGPLGYPGKNYRHIRCTFICTVAAKTPKVEKSDSQGSI